jgi:hypothetical protein
MFRGAGSCVIEYTIFDRIFTPPGDFTHYNSIGGLGGESNH